MNNPANMLSARIAFSRLRLETIKREEDEFKSMLTKAGVVNGTSPATTQAVREVFKETVANSDIKSIVQEMLAETKKRQITRKMFESMIQERYRKRKSAKSEQSQQAELSL